MLSGLAKMKGVSHLDAVTELMSFIKLTWNSKKIVSNDSIKIKGLID